MKIQYNTKLPIFDIYFNKIRIKSFGNNTIFILLCMEIPKETSQWIIFTMISHSEKIKIFYDPKL